MSLTFAFWMNPAPKKLSPVCAPYCQVVELLNEQYEAITVLLSCDPRTNSFDSFSFLRAHPSASQQEMGWDESSVTEIHHSRGQERTCVPHLSTPIFHHHA
jgi:hypothetical protein